MKILAVLSALDLKYRYGCTPAWWQLLKGLYENGVEVIATTYQGETVESPWWRVYPNPCRREAQAFTYLKNLKQTLIPHSSQEQNRDESLSDKAVRQLAQSWVKPRWERHLKDILRLEKDIQAIVVFTVPLNHFQGLPAAIKKSSGIPIFYYDGDVPASLPQFSGFASGFRIYQGADLSEYDGFICNSEGGAKELEKMGAHRVKTLFWGVDPDYYAPLSIPQDYDVSFYGYGVKYRQEWIENMLVQPGRQMPDNAFVIGGQGFDMDLGAVRAIGDVPLTAFRQFCCRSKINLNITRAAHASVYASSSCRPFELAAMGCCIVSNPCAGMERWFEPGKEILVVHSADEALETYQGLLKDANKRRELGQAAKRRVLAEHTTRQRAKELLEYLK
ncbi:MAG: glycosyltransferase [Candidatus Schekmanbacteria bacterium]|nr:glycosyltransferase [Candidatus Schekmanbacteria bacterium]